MRGAAPKRKVPPFGRRAHRLTHARARQMRERYLKRCGTGKLFSTTRDVITPMVYGRNIFDAILKQKACKGVRFYPGLDERGQVTIMFAGVDAEGNDILEGIIGDTPWRCPPFCASLNGVFQL